MRGALAVCAIVLLCSSRGSAADTGCRFETAGSLSFEAYDPMIGRATLGTGTMTVSCSEPATIMVTIGAGQSGDANHRTMVSPSGERLAYNFYSDAAYTTVWGDGSSAGAPTFSIPGGRQAVRITVYGAIAPRQNVVSGSYGDDPTVSLNL